MPRACSICTHAERDAIDRALVAGESARSIAARYGTVGRMALLRHADGHIPATMAKAQAAAEVAQADDLLKEVRALRAKSYSLLMKAEAAGDYRTALAGIREARGCLELLAKLLGELDERPTVNLVVSPEWQQVRAALLDALRPYPDARAAVAGRLRVIEGGRAAG